MHQVCVLAILLLLISTDQFDSKYGISSLSDHTYGHLGRSLACIAAVSLVTIFSATSKGATYSKKIGEKSNVEKCDGLNLLASGTRVTCSKMFERSRSLRHKQQTEFRTQHLKFVEFLGMRIYCNVQTCDSIIPRHDEVEALWP
jgi:DNA mismatch repair ATPase MutL